MCQIQGSVCVHRRGWYPGCGGFLEGNAHTLNSESHSPSVPRTEFMPPTDPATSPVSRGSEVRLVSPGSGLRRLPQAHTQGWQQLPRGNGQAQTGPGRTSCTWRGRYRRWSDAPESPAWVSLGWSAPRPGNQQKPTQDIPGRQDTGPVSQPVTPPAEPLP